MKRYYAYLGEIHELIGEPDPEEMNGMRLFYLCEDVDYEMEKLKNATTCPDISRAENEGMK